ncbi:uncharacterized protein LOC124944453 [Impatiens glandulifera]|uniref:uncharacterized protein LOC124944453 n=1 Tax=Impatiens glandulifera TaxID=253017 RepID=UPI001FB167CD|nr:uncharacterized protein LOC124944453 [Impatiens glandulifera]
MMTMITTKPNIFLHFSSNPHFPMDFQSKLPDPIFAFLLFLLSLSLISLAVLTFSLYQRLREQKRPSSVDKTLEPNLTHLSQSLLLEILSSNSPKWVTPSEDTVSEEGSHMDKDKVDSGGEECGKKKKKKKGKKKRTSSPNPKTEDQLELKKPELICSYPFTSSSSAIQRKIKQEYDQLVKSNQVNGLTLAQVGQFVNCLIESKNELQQRSDTIQRRFTITKALLNKADRSSFDRLHQQIYKIELEQKRLEEDAFVYNWLQTQIKLSPAYRKLLEVAAGMRLEATRKLEELEQNTDADFGDISFEELLAQEKKDSFWQKHRKSSRLS